MHEKEIKSVQYQTRSAFAELQILRKQNLSSQNAMKQEVIDLRAKCKKLEDELNIARDNSHENDLIEKNFQWAQENNELRAELVKTEQVAIDAKIKTAEKSALNDKLNHEIYELKKRIEVYKKTMQKYKSTISKSVS